MQLPSLVLVAASATQAARRFPFTLLCAGVAGVAGCCAVYFSTSDAALPGWVYPLLSAAALGLPLTLAVALAAERGRWPAAGRGAAQAVALLLLAGWYALAPARPGTVDGQRLALLLLALHLAVAAGPYLGELRRGADTPGFWRYNEALLRRLLTAGLYAGVLYAGAALALVAVRELFGFYFDSNAFGYLFIGLAAWFTTWFFLAGVPADWEALEQAAPYPRGLQAFTQFVLLPLVVLYAGILYAYLGRMLWLRALPEGWVSVLILALAVAGILALLLIHPLRESAEHAWIRTFARWFYRALFPLLALLAVAIGVRIAAYGLTEERYFVVVLAAWLLGLASYFLWRRGRGIIWVPVTLGLLALLAATGPWGAFAVAERSQLRQLQALTSRYHLLQGGHLDGAAGRVPPVPYEARLRLSSIFDFFADRDELASLQPQFAGSLHLPDSLRTRADWERSEWLTNRPYALSGFERLSLYAQALDSTAEQNVSFYASEKMRVYELSPGQYWLQNLNLNAIDLTKTDSVLLTLPTPADSFRLRAAAGGRDVLVQQRTAGSWRTQLRLSLAATIDSLVRARRGLPRREELPQPLLRQARAGRLHLRLFLTSLSRQQFGPDTMYNYSAEGWLRIRP